MNKIMEKHYFTTVKRNRQSSNYFPLKDIINDFHTNFDLQQIFM